MASPLASASALAPAASANHGLLSFLKEDPLPSQFGSITSEVPDLASTADSLKATGSALANQGTSALDMAQRGQLTGPQTAELNQFHTGLTNQARQQFYNMGRTPDKDTAFISQTADIDARVNAMAQQEIQSTIALGLGELSAGSNFFGQSLGFDNAAIQALTTAGTAQLAQDAAYKKSLTDTFGGIFKLFGSATGPGKLFG